MSEVDGDCTVEGTMRTGSGVVALPKHDVSNEFEQKEIKKGKIDFSRHR